jgi:hypothetical protein
VIGVAVATYKGGQNLNFAIPANALRTLLSLKAEVRPMSVLKKASSEKSILKDLGPPSTAGVIARKLEWGVFDFKFSVLNQLRQPIKDVSCVVIFFDDEDVPFDFKTVMLKNEIPAGLASWTDPVSVDINTCRNVNTTYRNLRKSEQMPKEGRTEIRVLGFELAD